MHNNQRDTNCLFNGEMIGDSKNGLLNYAIILILPQDNKKL